MDTLFIFKVWEGPMQTPLEAHPSLRESTVLYSTNRFNSS